MSTAGLWNARVEIDAVVKIGRYEILDEVGQGAMGMVYCAHDPLIERTVAIKTVPIEQLQREGPDAETRFLREAQSAGRLSHTSIVTIYDVGEADGLAYIAMEYLPGATLRDVMNRGKMPVELVIDTTLQMAEALAFAHEHGVIHRDIKPANVVVTGQNGRIKLTDFGIAHLANSSHTHSGQMLGSPRYMSPEQAMGREIDGRSDIFSLGAVLYEMLTGHYAFDGDSLPSIVFRVINETPVAVASLRPHLPAGLVDLLAQMLRKRPDERPDASTVVKALQALAPSSQLPAAIPSNRVSRLLPVLAFGTPLGVFLIIGIGIIVIGHFLGNAEQAPHPTRQDGVSNHHEAVPGSALRPNPAIAGRPARAPAVPRSPQKGADNDDPYLQGLDKKEVELRIQRSELLLKYTEQHPDVVQVDRQLEQLQAERGDYLKQRKKNRKD